jgi:deoxyribodipyrimidine photo-lyase
MYLLVINKMTHIFLFHRDLRIQDNTTLIHQIKTIEKPVIPIFIFTPEQIDRKTNKYFSDNSVQFMCESLHELADEIKKQKGKMLFFKGDNLKVLKEIHKIAPIESVGFNIDYTPYAKARDQKIKTWCDSNNIICFMKEDYALFDLLNGQTNKSNGTPYLVYTPFMKHVLGNIQVRPIDKFKSWNFAKKSNLEEISYNINESDINTFYTQNPQINVQGGRSNTLKILAKLDNFKTYNKSRDTLTYKTTFLGPSLHFTTCSIREIYHKIVSDLDKYSGLIRELIFRDFYINIIHNFPRVLQGQIKGKNKSYKEEYDNITWVYNKKIFEAWCTGTTGFPVIDAAQRQLNTTGYMHNRCRMITSSFLTKDLHIDWLWGEQYFATKLVDYDPINNSQGWQWSTGNGTDAQPWFRIFNPWTQQKTHDIKAEYIKYWIPELKQVEPIDIHNWFKPEVRSKYQQVIYPAPIVDHDQERKDTIIRYKAGLK